MNSEETRSFVFRTPPRVIEMDGDVHDLQKEDDERREKVLSEMGLRIVRFRNDEVMRGLSAAVGKMKELIAK